MNGIEQRPKQQHLVFDAPAFAQRSKPRLPATPMLDGLKAIRAREQVVEQYERALAADFVEELGDKLPIQLMGTRVRV